MGDEGIVLTDREREALAGLAEQIGDPWLAQQLAGGEASPPPEPKRTRRLAGVRETLLRVTAGRAGLLLVVAGAALAVTTFAGSIPLGALGLALMGLGTWRVAVEKADDVILRWKTARQGRQAMKPPLPPRTPPGAA